MIIKDILNYIETFQDRDAVLAFIINLRENLNWKVNIDDESLMKLMKDDIITRDYIKREFILLFPVYTTDERITHIPKVNKIDDRINEFRYLFKGVRIGNMGNKQQCIDLMNEFMTKHPEITFDQIIAATIYYIQNTDFQYIMSAPNFIYKYDNNEYTSKLEVVLEEYLLSEINSNLL